MARKQYIPMILFIAGFILTSCNDEEQESKALAKKYCSSCHLFPDPAELDKTTWKKNVLPVMGRLLGAQQPDQHPFEESDRIISNQKSLVSGEDWQKILDYYVSNAPDQLPQQDRPAIEKITSLFNVEKRTSNRLPSNTFLKIDTVNKWIYAGAMDSTLTVFDNQLNPVKKINPGGITVDMFFNEKQLKPGVREGVMTDIGFMHPNDLKTGAGFIFSITDNGEFQSRKIIDTVPRPVQTIAVDLDVDGRVDYVVCGFGNKQGSFFWMRNTGNKTFEQKMLRPLPGAIKAYIEDINNDNLPDIIALFAQGDEGIYLFLNKGNGEFETRNLLRFSPVYGSTSFEMIDFNKDGEKDIVYTCGDNADYSNVLKSYHGIYIYINEGNFSFKKTYFFPLHGAFKALTRDFDKDGDLDIAAVSYFPDMKNQPKEGFVFLEQTAALKFTPYSIKEFNEGRWITMDAGDIDQDGDEDIVIGSLYLPQEAERSKEDLTRKPAFLLLRNNSVRK